MTEPGDPTVREALSVWGAHADAELALPAELGVRALREGRSRYRWRTARSTFVVALCLAVLATGLVGFWAIDTQRALEAELAEQVIGGPS